MNFSRLDRLIKINSDGLFERHREKRDRLVSDLYTRKMLNSGPGFKSLVKSMKEDVADYSEVFISSLTECIRKGPTVTDQEKQRIISQYLASTNNFMQNFSADLNGRLLAAGFAGLMTNSILNFLHLSIKQVQEIGLLKIENVLDNDRIVSKEDSKDHVAGWDLIKQDYGISKREFGKRINFVNDKKIRRVIFRDVAQAHALALQNTPKPAIILAGGVIEELLWQYLIYKNIKVPKKEQRFENYIKYCEENELLNPSILKLSDFVREYRNFVHIGAEIRKQYKIEKYTAKGIVASIFTIASEF